MLCFAWGDVKMANEYKLTFKEAIDSGFKPKQSCLIGTGVPEKSWHFVVWREHPCARFKAEIEAVWLGLRYGRRVNPLYVMQSEPLNVPSGPPKCVVCGGVVGSCLHEITTTGEKSIAEYEGII